MIRNYKMNGVYKAHKYTHMSSECKNAPDCNTSGMHAGSLYHEGPDGE